MVSTRAANVAEVLFELKRANKVATYSVVAARAGFSAGSNNRTIKTAMKHVRRDWPHLQWWRAIIDDGLIEAEQARELIDGGYEIETSEVEDKKSILQLDLASLENDIMVWEDESTAEDSGDTDTDDDDSSGEEE